jgi:hypothetical protein
MPPALPHTLTVPRDALRGGLAQAFLQESQPILHEIGDRVCPSGLPSDQSEIGPFSELGKRKELVRTSAQRLAPGAAWPIPEVGFHAESGSVSVKMPQGWTKPA